MKNFFMAIIVVFTSFSAFAQTNKVDERLLAKYSIEELNTLKAENPDEFKFINYCIDNAFYIQDIPQEKLKTNPERIGKIKIADINNINFYALNIDLIENDYQFFAIEGTDKLLVIKSKYHILKELNK